MTGGKQSKKRPWSMRCAIFGRRSVTALRHHVGVASQAVSSYWRALTLAQQFLAIAIVPISFNTIILGAWISYQVSVRYINANAAATAIYIESFIAPLLEELSHDDELTPASIAALGMLGQTPPFSEHIAWFKIWNPQGKILYSNNPAIRGKVFALTNSLTRALAGDVVPKYDDFDHEGDNTNRSTGNVFLEIYVPVRLEGSDRIVAVAEIYEVADKLKKDLVYIRLETWLIVSGLSLWMTAVLFVIVRRGSDTILRQRHRLTTQVGRLSAALDKVRTLNTLVDEAHNRAITSTERYIRRIGSDLHDGPAQRIGLALLLVEKLSTGGTSTARTNASKINGLLSGALQEIRSIAAGLAPPELDSLSVEEALLLVAKNHEWNTGTAVTTSILSVPEDVQPLMKISLFRFAQEGLSNAFKHAGGEDQTLRAKFGGGLFIVEVTDSGAGLPPNYGSVTRPKLGLAIMRDRIESLNGTFEIESQVGGGTLVRASFRIPEFLPTNSDDGD